MQQLAFAAVNLSWAMALLRLGAPGPCRVAILPSRSTCATRWRCTQCGAVEEAASMKA